MELTRCRLLVARFKVAAEGARLVGTILVAVAVVVAAVVLVVAVVFVLLVSAVGFNGGRFLFPVLAAA